MQHLTDEGEKQSDEKANEEDDKLPRVTRSNLTRSLYRRTAYVTRICAHVTDTAAVDVFLNSQKYLTCKYSTHSVMVLVRASHL